MAENKNKNKFTWREGELEVTLSQCSNCKFNSSILGCGQYGKKPLEYATNDAECPQKEAEE